MNLTLKTQVKVQIKTPVPDNENTFKAARQLPLPFRNTHHFIISCHHFKQYISFLCKWHLQRLATQNTTQNTTQNSKQQHVNRNQTKIHGTTTRRIKNQTKRIHPV
jgi:hypothetical protein